MCKHFVEDVWIHMEAKHNVNAIQQDILNKKTVTYHIWIQMTRKNLMIGILKQTHQCR